jgi:hypothetical protein
VRNRVTILTNRLSLIDFIGVGAVDIAVHLRL